MKAILAFIKLQENNSNAKIHQNVTAGLERLIFRKTMGRSI